GVPSGRASKAGSPTSPRPAQRCRESCREKRSSSAILNKLRAWKGTAVAFIIGNMQPALNLGFQLSFRRLLMVLCAVAAFALCLAAKDFAKPAARPAQTYPAHDD